MLCLPPETLNRRAAPVKLPQPRPARPSRAAGSCYHHERTSPPTHMPGLRVFAMAELWLQRGGRLGKGEDFALTKLRSENTQAERCFCSLRTVTRLRFSAFDDLSSSCESSQVHADPT